MEDDGNDHMQLGLDMEDCEVVKESQFASLLLGKSPANKTNCLSIAKFYDK
jgi:hypothetical protein